MSLEYPDNHDYYKLIKQLKIIQTLEQNIIKLKTAVEYFDEIINSEEPNRMILQMLIDKICIYRDKIVIFKLKTDINKTIE